MDPSQVESYEIRSYEIRFSFLKESYELKEVTISFTQQVSDVILDSYFKLIINELTEEMRTIVVPNGVENLE